MTYEEFGIDPTRLKRDYIKNPYKLYSNDIIHKNDLEYLYNELYLPKNTIASLIGLSVVQLNRKLRTFDIKRLVKITNTDTLIAIVDKYSIDLTKLKRNYIKNPLRRFANKKFEKPYKEDLVYLYRELNINVLVLAKFFSVKRSCFNNWIHEYRIQKPKSESNKLSQKTNLERYGVKNPGQLEEVKNKIKQTNLERYGYESYSKTKAFSTMLKDKKELIQRKVYDTKKYNKSFKISKQEDRFYDMLIQKFPDTKRQYKSELYPFACDFYVFKKDLYIECNFHWTHGKEPFDKNNAEHINKIKLWKSKNTKFYNIAIDVWTIRDPLKRKTAKENNLNCIEFFNLDEAKKWLTSIDK